MGTTVNFARVVACALVACSLAPASAAPRRDVRIGMALEPPGLDPTAGAASAIGEVTQFNVFEQLVRIKEDFTVAPGLATSWTFSDDLKTLTFKLREGVKFQNGEPFTSADVKFSFERAAAEDSTDKDKAFFASIASIDAPDPSTVTLVFKAPSYQALYHLGFASASIVEPKSAPTDAVKPVGTGPYELADWQKGSSLTLKAWPGYRDAASVKIEAATFRFISDPAAQVAAMLAGDLDAFPRFGAFDALDKLRADPRFRVAVGGTQGKTIVAINERHAPLGDVRVRRAICSALDRKAIVDGAMNGLGAPIGSHYVPGLPGYVDLTGACPHDPAKARALLAQAGVKTPLTLTLKLPPPSYARLGGQIVAAELAEVGIVAKIENVEWAQWLANVYGGAHDYDLTIVSHVEPLDIGIYGNKDYYFGYDSAAFRAILAKLDASPDAAAYAERIGEAQRKLADDAVNAYLFQLPAVLVADRRLDGLWTQAPILTNDLAALSWR